MVAQGYSSLPWSASMALSDVRRTTSIMPEIRGTADADLGRPELGEEDCP